MDRWHYVVLAAASALYHVLATRRDRRLYPPPGRLVDLGTHRLHILETGHVNGGPAIVLEAGLMSTVLSWTYLQRELSRSFRVVSYDRVGLGWSDLGPMPRTANRMVTELHELLERAGVRPPYVLVDHSFGGLTVPIFAARFPKDVVGVVLIDPVVPAEWHPPSDHSRSLVSIGAKVCRRAAILAHIGLIRFIAALITSGAKKYANALIRLISRGTSTETGSVSSPWFWALPEEEKALVPILWIHSKFALTIASQLENLPTSAAQVDSHGVFSDSPCIVLSASTSSPRRSEGHAAIADRLPQGQHIVAKNSNHWIMPAESRLVLDAIVEVASQVADAPIRRSRTVASGR
ncbi:MAG: alpha/beta fold hydrolase [Candidatus Acidiferrum sp.]